MIKKKEVEQPKPQKPSKKCRDCGEPTTNYYPVYKSKENEVRCDECQMRYVRATDELIRY